MSTQPGHIIPRKHSERAQLASYVLVCPLSYSLGLRKDAIKGVDALSSALFLPSLETLERSSMLL